MVFHADAPDEAAELARTPRRRRCMWSAAETLAAQPDVRRAHRAGDDRLRGAPVAGRDTTGLI